jgi:uncharacterized metal-binding protein/predicted Fe-Mo cluster-binding NifX family protein
MRVALPLFGSRVSPRCGIAREVAVVTVEGRDIVARVTHQMRLDDEDDLLERLIEWGCDVLVCGGIRRDFSDVLAANNIRVVQNVAGELEEVVAALCRDELLPGHGLGPAPTAVKGPGTLPEVNCIGCQGRQCMSGLPCAFDPAGEVVPPLDRRAERIYEVGRDVSAESDPKLCRIAELVHFCVGMGYERVGLAFCWELFHEAESLTRVLSRFFTVIPVCCRIGTGTVGERVEGGRCNPVLQARILNGAKTDLNVLAGLCLGCDLLFTAESQSPVTTLFVKDRSLSHNPVAAIYTRYHLEDLELRGANSRPANGSGRK